MNTSNMIDYVIVIFGNYDLLDLQVENFKKRLPKKDYRLIVVDNTIDSQKRKIEPDPFIDEFVLLSSQMTHDGVSHGRAIDEGLKYCTSDIVSIIAASAALSISMPPLLLLNLLLNFPISMVVTVTNLLSSMIFLLKCRPN